MSTVEPIGGLDRGDPVVLQKYTEQSIQKDRTIAEKCANMQICKYANVQRYRGQDLQGGVHKSRRS